MNKQFYEFWGHLFLNLARGQQQVEDLTNLMKQGLSGMNQLAETFSRSYGLVAPSADSTQSAQTSTPMADFQHSLNQLAAMWGWVSQADHQRVVRDCEALRKKVEEQEAVISQLRDLLNQEGRGHTLLVDHLQHSLKEQNEQFQSLMKAIRDSFDAGQ